MKIFKEYLFLIIILLMPFFLFFDINFPILNNLPNYKVFYKELIAGNYFYIVIFSFYIMISVFFIYRIYRYYKPRWRVRKAKEVLLKIRQFNTEKSHLSVLNYLKKIDPFVFEELLLTCFKESGCKIKRNRRYTGDGGIDGKVWINGKQHLIQAKRYSGHIKKSHVEEFITLCKKKRKSGLFIHTGRIGRESLALINNERKIKNIHDGFLIDFIISPKEAIVKIKKTI
jgi:restriction system protein